MVTRPPLTRQYSAYRGNTTWPWWTTSLDVFLAVAIMVMLLWPWLFVGAILNQDGIQMNYRLANFVTNHPQSTQYFITFIGTVVSTIVAYLFSKAIFRLSQQWVTPNHQLDLFDVSFISGLRNQNNPWGFPDVFKNLFSKGWTIRVIIVLVCCGLFLNVASGVASLLGPAPINKKTSFQETELDFASNDPGCITWLTENEIPNRCDWTSYKGLNFTSCLGENQMVDVLQSGRDNILSLISDNSQSIDFTQLGAKNGLQFLGPIRGILPLGPNGVLAFDTLAPSPLSDPGVLSYNYTLELQGLNSNVNCEYIPHCPVQVLSVVGETIDWVVQSNGTCDGNTDFLMAENVTQYIQMNSSNGLASWACKSAMNETGLSYFFHLHGYGNYGTEIGNITCTISPIQPAVFSVTYDSVRNTFSSPPEPVSVAPVNFTGFLDRSIVALGGLIAEAQNMQDNLVAESIITFGIKSFNLPERQQNQGYLKLYEAMIQGIIEYLTTYSRLVYSTASDLPTSCTRQVMGNATYAVLGWSVNPEHIGFLLPMTFINMVAFCIMIFVICQTKGNSFQSDPIDIRSLVLAEHHRVDSDKDQSGWTDVVTFRDRTTSTTQVAVDLTQNSKYVHSQAYHLILEDPES